MRRWDQIASVLGTTLGVLLVIFSLRMDLGQWNHPGPGFMPLSSGMLLIVLCIAYGVWSIWMKDDDYKRRESPWPKRNLGRLFSVLAGLFLFNFLLPILGYLLSTFLLMIFLFRVLESEKWFITLFKAALSVLVTYVVFDKWLMVQFPKGLLGL